GTLTIAGAQNYAAGSVLNANAGITNINSDGGANLSVNANATTNFAAAQNLASLTVGSGATATLAAGGTNVLNTANLSVSSGKLDLKDNDAIVHSGSIGTVSGGTYSGLTGLIQSGRNGGGWNGSGIVTSLASGHLITLGIASAAEAKGIAAGETAVWNGQTVTGSDALIMYTYGGDANLDGKIDVDDYGRMDFRMPSGATGWSNGDFNYDGKVNVDDYGIIDFNIGIQGPS